MSITADYVRIVDNAACAGTLDENFTACESRSAAINSIDRAAKEHLAAKFCQRCPALQACSDFADEHRYIGLFGGYLRTLDRTSGYHAEPLIPNAPRRAAALRDAS